MLYTMIGEGVGLAVYRRERVVINVAVCTVIVHGGREGGMVARWLLKER